MEYGMMYEFYDKIYEHFREWASYFKYYFLFFSIFSKIYKLFDWCKWVIISRLTIGRILEIPRTWCLTAKISGKIFRAISLFQIIKMQSSMYSGNIKKIIKNKPKMAAIIIRDKCEQQAKG